MKLVIISDTHGWHGSLRIPPGDVLIHAGDFTRRGKLGDLIEFNDFLAGLPHSEKIIIAGNHDHCCEKNPGTSRKILTNCTYLRDQEVSIGGYKFYGSPWQPWFLGMAFNLKRGPEIRSKWRLIPDDTDVLITHGPPGGIGDRTARGRHVGCKDLLEEIKSLQPKLHIFGHIHEAYGVTVHQHTTFINASSCDRLFQPVHEPVIYHLPEP